jgi:hypothetical protein
MRLPHLQEATFTLLDISPLEDVVMLLHRNVGFLLLSDEILYSRRMESSAITSKLADK